MDNRRIQQLCEEEALGTAARLFGTDTHELKFMNISENVVYSFKSDDQDFVLRLTHRGGRSRDQVQAELDWLDFLHTSGAPVHRPRPSIKGNLVETVPTSKRDFQVTAFKMVKGRELEDGDINDGVVEEWGQLIGRLHRLTKDYSPAAGAPRRFSWDEDDDLVNMEKYIPRDQHRVMESFRKTISHLRELPRSRDSYGLIHSDAHYGNFLMTEGGIVLFDFDDCFYTWFALDLATVWYWALYLPQGEDDRRGFMEHFRKTFMAGYNRENRLDDFWLERIPLFLQYQEMLLYIYFHRITDPREITDEERIMIQGYRDRIENGTLYFGALN